MSIVANSAPLVSPRLFLPTPREDFHWYALYTRARHEKTVAGQLRLKCVDTFMPLISQTHRWSDRRKIIQAPLFPSYTFVRFSATPANCLEILRTPGVVEIVGMGHRNIPIPDDQIEALRRVLAHNAPCGLFPFLRVGQRVRIRGGCLEGLEGLLVALKGERSLVISIEPIQSSVAIRLQGYEVELI
ncbi:MAG: UpxY family transcription antiterminator [Candidatus Acidiferrales bacterium]